MVKQEHVISGLEGPNRFTTRFKSHGQILCSWLLGISRPSPTTLINILFIIFKYKSIPLDRVELNISLIT